MQDPSKGELKPIRVAFLGLAHLHPRSYKLLLGYLPGVSVVAAAEADGKLLDGFTRDFSLRAYTDWRSLLDREAINLAVLFLPHAECPAAAAACAERGIHILAEKPMAADSAGIRRMIEAARRGGVTLSAPYVWRYHPVSCALKDLVAAGALGETFAGEGRYAAGLAHRYVQAAAGWMLNRARSGGGSMHNLGVHWIDLFRWLLDDEVTEVMGRTIRLSRKHDVEDVALALLTFSRGTVIELHVSYSVPEGCPGGRDLFIGLRGRQGLVSWQPSLERRKQNFFLCSDAPGQEAAEGREIECEFPPQPGYAGICGRAFLEDFVGAIRAERSPAVSGTDGLRALQVVEAIYRSAETCAAARPEV